MLLIEISQATPLQLLAMATSSILVLGLWLAISYLMWRLIR